MEGYQNEERVSWIRYRKMVRNKRELIDKGDEMRNKINLMAKRKVFDKWQKETREQKNKCRNFKYKKKIRP
jgi:hypothetical protein